MSGGQNHRSIHYAVLASILLHGLMLFGYSPRDASRRAEAPAPILARLVEPVPAPAPAVTQPAAPQPQPVKPKPQAREKPPAPTLAKPSAVPQPVAKAAPQEALAPPAPVEEPAAPEAPAAPPAIARVDPVPSAPASGPPAAAVIAPAADAGSLDQYRLQLIGIAKKYKRYPRVAIDNNWEGDVVVRMVIGANGMISSLSIKTSSGHTVLDQQALEMFKKAKPLVPIPPALRGKEFTIEVRANYNLKDGQDPG